MENQVFRCTRHAITQRRVITLGPIFIQMVLNRAQGLKKKSQEVSVRKNNNRQRYNKKCRGGGGFRPPPGSFRVKKHLAHKISMPFLSSLDNLLSNAYILFYKNVLIILRPGR